MEYRPCLNVGEAKPPRLAPPCIRQTRFPVIAEFRHCLPVDLAFARHLISVYGVSAVHEVSVRPATSLMNSPALSTLTGSFHQRFSPEG